MVKKNLVKLARVLRKKSKDVGVKLTLPQSKTLARIITRRGRWRRGFGVTDFVAIGLSQGDATKLWLLLLDQDDPNAWDSWGLKQDILKIVFKLNL